MVASRRSTVVASIALACTVAAWAVALSGLISVSDAIWITLAVALGAFVGVKFNRHVEAPEQVKLH